MSGAPKRSMRNTSRDQKIDDARLDAIEKQNAVQTEILDRVVRRLDQ